MLFIQGTFPISFVKGKEHVIMSAGYAQLIGRWSILNRLPSPFAPERRTMQFPVPILWLLKQPNVSTTGRKGSLSFTQ